MSDSKLGDFEKPGNKKAKSGELEDGPSSFPLPWYVFDEVERTVGGTDHFEDTAWIETGLREEAEMDPLAVFGSGIMMMILSKLDARSVALARLVSREWLMVASSDIIWAPKRVRRKNSKCEELWLEKAHIPRISKVGGLPKFAAYSLATMDYKRTRITRNDLCDHVWEFHFTEAAPEYWRNLDPHWAGTGTNMRRYFHPDGSITADPEDDVWGGHESCYTIVTGLLENGTVRQHYVRINRWPPLTVQRKEDWSWQLSNHLYCYTSVPDADKEQGTGPPFPLF